MAEGCDARILAIALADIGVGIADDFVAQLIGSDVHGAELRDTNELTPAPHPLLPIEHVAGARALGADGRHEHERKEHAEQHGAENNVEHTLDGALGAGEVWLIEVKQR